ncbi:MAG TPA: ATP-dependent Clp protease proteolytic subunit [Chloroflexota bacterium]|nr:ATP-dependent Clp protease proteolytic subunit [Chloroflexota bacterium]
MNLPPELQAALLGRRVVFLRGRLDDPTANAVIAQLLLIARTGAGPEAEKAIELYLDSPGGSVGAALGVYDMLRTLNVPVSTICNGRAGGASVLILAGGASGLRYALPNARIHLTDESVDVLATHPKDLASSAAEAARLRARWQDALVGHTAHSAAQIGRDLSQGRWLSAAEARDYGLVDGIIPGPT